jgi:hypothetical protein
VARVSGRKLRDHTGIVSAEVASAEREYASYQV